MSRLEEIIRDEIIKDGPVTFARFMELALYHPEYGYYSSGQARIGKEGDYYTSPCVHPAFGQTVARFLTGADHAIKKRDFSVIEVGGGRGHLASDILDSLKDSGPGLYSRLGYYFVEKSPRLQSEARELLSRHGETVRFAGSLSEIGEKGINGAVISNELLDALPFHRAKFEKGGLREIFVAYDGGRFREVTAEPTTREILRYFEDYSPGFEEGREVEINLLAPAYLADMANTLVRGFLLTIDYGYLAPELYSPLRRKGTYKCIHEHRINEDPYVNIGEQDITAHVDFSSLIRAGESAGLSTVKYTTQGQFLIDWGILDIMEEGMGMEGETELSHGGGIVSLKNLFLPGSMGDSFKVLLQEKKVIEGGREFYPESPLTVSFNVL